MKTSSDLIDFITNNLIACGVGAVGYYEYYDYQNNDRYFEFDERELKTTLTKILEEYEQAKS